MDLPTTRGSFLDRLVADRKVRAAYISLVGHVAALLVLALLAAASRPRERAPIRITMFAAEATDSPDVEILGVREVAAPRGLAEANRSETSIDLTVIPQDKPTVPDVEIALEALPWENAHALPGSVPTVADIATSLTPLLTVAASPAQTQSDNAAASGLVGSRSAFAGRRGEARSRGVLERGGSAASEAAVERALEWLARHQAADGSWRFDLSGCRCDGACSHSGTVTSTTAATGIALLPFLGAGHTHAEGAYRETVTRGLYYLMSRMTPSPRGGDLSEGTMYGHGVATLVLAEALGMTDDPMLAPYVRDAVRFIETSQDMHGGGWRYLPGQAGDTTVTAWQIAALKSAALAGAAVPSPTIDTACRFLDRVQVRQGEGYGYLAPQDRSCTSAIGLLCRIYTAWPEVETLDRGLARLARPGPGPEAVYQNFYLAQALLLRDHPAWSRWNIRNRDHLVARQARSGHESGSWTFADTDTAPGGRLGHTALATLTLEVYYRLLPIYGERAAETGW